jgi:hypothetical protein
LIWILAFLHHHHPHIAFKKHMANFHIFFFQLVDFQIQLIIHFFHFWQISLKKIYFRRSYLNFNLFELVPETFHLFLMIKFKMFTLLDSLCEHLYHCHEDLNLLFWWQTWTLQTPHQFSKEIIFIKENWSFYWLNNKLNVTFVWEHYWWFGNVNMSSRSIPLGFYLTYFIIMK